MPLPNLLGVYTHLIGWTFVGWVLGHYLPKTTPARIGKFLFWIGVPISILAFLRHANVQASLWLAPAVAIAAVLSGMGLAWLLIQSRGWHPRTKGGSTMGAYGLGVALASQFGVGRQGRWQSLRAVVQNPALWSFGVGLLCRDLPLPAIGEISLKGFAWFIISLSLVLVGMRLSQLKSLSHIKPAIASLAIKMTLIPLILGLCLQWLGIHGLMHRVLLLQMAMPPAFATLVISEAYELDQELTVTTLVLGCLFLLVTLPMWLWLFG